MVYTQCNVCDGRGVVYLECLECYGSGHDEYNFDCLECVGEGQIDQACPECEA